MGQIWPTTSFDQACELRMIFTFYNDWKKSSDYFITYENYMKSSFNVNKVLLEHKHAIHLHTSFATVAELSSCLLQRPYGPPRSNYLLSGSL